MERHAAWLEQAKDDLKWAHDTLARDYFAQTCFICQQIAEKALKAFAYFQGIDFIKSHSIVSIAETLDINGEILAAGQVLDLYYTTTRYPDTLPDMGVPRDHFGRHQAEGALELAEKVLNNISSRMAPGEP